MSCYLFIFCIQVIYDVVTAGHGSFFETFYKLFILQHVDVIWMLCQGIIIKQCIIYLSHNTRVHLNSKIWCTWDSSLHSLGSVYPVSSLHFLGSVLEKAFMLWYLYKLIVLYSLLDETLWHGNHMTLLYDVIEILVSDNLYLKLSLLSFTQFKALECCRISLYLNLQERCHFRQFLFFF